MATDEDINRRLISEWEYDIDNLDKPLSERHRRSNLKEGFARRYPELADDNYLASMKDILPKVKPVKGREDARPMALSSNTNVQRYEYESLLNG